MSDNGFNEYAREVAKYDILTEQQEIELTTIIQMARDAKAQLANDNLTEREIRRYQNLINAGRDAQEQLVNANLRFGIHLAKRYTNRGLELMDLIQEANSGIMRAAERYELGRGTRFATYAAIWIRQSIMRALANQARTIRVPTHMFDTINQVNRVTQQLNHELGRAPEADDIADKMTNKAAHHIELALANNKPTLSLDDSALEDGDLYGEMTADTIAPSAHEIQEHKALSAVLEAVLGTLTERESQVIKLRYGFIDGNQITLEEIGQMFGVTRQRIQQIESAAMKKMQAYRNSLSAFSD